MKRIIFFMIAFLLLSGCRLSGGSSTSAGNTTNISDYTTMEEQTMEVSKLLTPEQLIEIAELPQGFYDNDYLQRFIEYYGITENEAQKWNIKRFLENFEAIESQIDVRDIFDETPSGKVPSDPAAITVIAFYENISDGIESVYYDFQSMNCYRGSNIDLFYDLGQITPRTMEQSEANALREAMIENGVLDWQPATASDDLIDPQAMGLAIRFADGSLFRVTVSGLLYEDGPSHYEAVRDLLLGD